MAKPRLGEVWIDVPRQASALAAKGIEARRLATPSKRCCTVTGIRRAHELVDGQQQDAVLLRAWFRRHHGYYQKAVKRSGSSLKSAMQEPAIQAWWMWGGDPMHDAVEKAVDAASRS